MATAAIPDDESSSQMAEEYLQSKGLVLLLPYFLIAFPKIQHHVCWFWTEQVSRCPPRPSLTQMLSNIKVPYPLTIQDVTLKLTQAFETLQSPQKKSVEVKSHKIQWKGVTRRC